MSNTIYKDQQSAENVKLLAAQKQAYYEGKLYSGFIFWAAIISGVVFPALSIALSDNQWIGLLGGFLGLIFAFPLSNIVQKKAQTGATIQEEFDFNVYGWDWSNSSAGMKVNEYEKNRLARKLKDWSNLKPNGKDQPEIKPWYQNYSNLDQSHAILACQSENLYWDSRQKRKYAHFLLKIGVVFFVLSIGSFLVPGFTPLEILARIYFPLLSALVILGVNSAKILSTSAHLDRVIPIAQKVQERSLAQGDAIREKDLLEIQEIIYAKRREGYLIPEWFYKREAQEFEQDLSGKA